MLWSIVFVHYGIIVSWIVFVTEAADVDKPDWCVELEKKIVKEYECCLQERKRELPVPLTSWFPSLPSRSAASDLNLTVDKLIHLYCSIEIHDVACNNQMLDRVYRARKCVGNETLQFVQTRATVLERRRKFLCDKKRAFELYNNEAHDCLQVKQSSLCLTHIMINFDLEAIKHQPNCDEFQRLLNCLQDEWIEKCGQSGSGSLLALLKAMYIHFHCPDYVEIEPTIASDASTNFQQCFCVVILFIFLLI